MLKPFADAFSTYHFIEPAIWAPSVYNTQPWWFRITADDRVELRANVDDSAGARRGRWDLMLNSDAPGPWPREFAISSGAALFNLRMAFRVVGHDPVVTLVPDPASDPGLLASVEVVVGRTRPPSFLEQELYAAIWNRHTDRWPYTRHPVRPAILVAMERAAAKEHGWLRPLHGAHLRNWLRAAEHADRILRDQAVAGDDPFRSRLAQYRAELAEWTGQNADGCGVPGTAFGPPPAKLPGPVRDFTLGDPGDVPRERFERDPQLLVLCTEHDEPIDWLRTGQALQRALLAATGFGVTASFLTQPLELADLRFMCGAGNGLPAGPGEPARGIGIPRYGNGVDGFQRASASAADRRSYARRRLLGLTPWLEVPQMVMRVGYPARNARKPDLRTGRADPEVIDARTDPPTHVRRPPSFDPAEFASRLAAGNG